MLMPTRDPPTKNRFVDAFLGFGSVFNSFGAGFTLVYSMGSMILAFSCSCLIGLVFGFLPARNASRMNPVAALARD
jgi:macrolide transport system ATP-binding/permease protein